VNGLGLFGLAVLDHHVFHGVLAVLFTRLTQVEIRAVQAFVAVAHDREVIALVAGHASMHDARHAPVGGFALEGEVSGAGEARADGVDEATEVCHVQPERGEVEAAQVQVYIFVAAKEKVR